MKFNCLKSKIFKIDNLQQFKSKALAWAQANAFDIVCYLDRNQHPIGWQAAEAYLAVRFGDDAPPLSTPTFEQFSQFFALNQHKWLFGFLSYDLKNDLENSLYSNHFDGIGFPNWHFFEPSILIKMDKQHIQIWDFTPPSVSPIFGELENIFSTILQNNLMTNNNELSILEIKKRFEKDEYLHILKKLKEHIIEGDFYELNFCQEFFAENVQINPFQLFWELNEQTQKPFAAFYKCYERFLLCASPERFLKKQANKVISQPIKGTSRRGNSPSEDDLLKLTLQNDPKNRAENVMIVDLVRNDLAKVCKIGSVKVPELFGIHTFETVHQLISTVEGELLRGGEVAEIIALFRATFPMGSMTGAPKIMTMKMIEVYERTRRGVYSGAVGFFSPDGNFDFNVVIRSILYNLLNSYLSFQVGGAIVFDSDPEAEYEECLIKASAILKVLKTSLNS